METNKVLLVGAGNGGTSILNMAAGQQNDFKIVGIADIDEAAPGVLLAKAAGIPYFADYKEALKVVDANFVVDVTGDPQVQKDLQSDNGNSFELINGATAKLIWKVIDVRQQNEQEIKELLNEYKALYQIGLMLSYSDSLELLFNTIIEQAMKFTDSPASSLAVYREHLGEMEFVASKGFSKKFVQVSRWKVRTGGMTSDILNNKEPTTIENIADHPKFDNPLMINEGIKSISAAPLFAEGKIVGILYVDDYKTRKFSDRELQMFSLLSTLAALAIVRAQTIAETKREAITDGLTGLFNHRHFSLSLRQELSRSARYKSPVSLIMFDIDYFKKFNDEYGHLEGNNLLMQISKILTQESRDSDVVARYGGEEFALIMTQTDKEGAFVCADRIIKAVCEYQFKDQNDEPVPGVTMSGGVASFPDDAKDPIKLIEKADKALYRAKASGRNKIVQA